MIIFISLRPFGFVIAGLLCLFSVQLRADHLIGGEFAYACRGFLNDDPATDIKVYDVTLNIYRNCLATGAYFDGVGRGTIRTPQGVSAPAHLTIYRGDEVFEASLSILLDTVMEVDFSIGNPCFEIVDPICQEIGVYRFTLELPVSDETYNISYQRCCRNGAILNIANPEGSGSTYAIRITPEAQNRCNASPVFNSTPPIAICINEPFDIDLSAAEADGDSLVYRFCSPFTGGSRNDPAPQFEPPPPYNEVAFRAPLYTVAQQFGPGSTLNIDPVTGRLTGIPITRGKFTVGICVEEWSRGPNPILLSDARRDFELNIILCEDRVSAALPAAETSLEGIALFRQCGPGDVFIRNSSTDPAFITSYRWEVDGPDSLLSGALRDLRTRIDVPGVYTGRMLLNLESTVQGCRDTVFFQISIFPESVADFTFTQPGCDDEPVEFTDQTVPNGNNSVVAWDWNFADGSPPGERANPEYLYRDPGEFPVTLTTTDNNGCRATATKTIVYFPTPRTLLVEPQEDFGCVPFNKTFVNLSRPVNTDYRYEWAFGDGGVDTVNSPAYRYEAVGIYDVYLGITSPTGCFADTIFRELVDVRPLPIADFSWSPEVPTNLDPLFTVTDQSQESTSFRYELYDRAGTLLRYESTDFDYEFRDSASLFVTQVVVHPGGCRDTITREISQAFLNTFFMPDAFTPNGDGLNDLLLPVGILQRTNAYRFEVWSRWGQKMFATDNVRAAWDGNFQGKSSPDGLYLWNAEYLDADGKRQHYKGGVSLFR